MMGLADDASPATFISQAFSLSNAELAGMAELIRWFCTHTVIVDVPLCWCMSMQCHVLCRCACGPFLHFHTLFWLCCGVALLRRGIFVQLCLCALSVESCHFSAVAPVCFVSQLNCSLHVDAMFGFAMVAFVIFSSFLHVIFFVCKLNLSSWCWGCVASAYARISLQEPLLAQAAEALHNLPTKSGKCIQRFNSALDAASTANLKSRTDLNAAADFLVYPPAVEGSITTKGMTRKVHVCPASAMALNTPHADYLHVVQNNWHDKPCVAMMTQINNIRSGEHILVINKVITKTAFHEKQCAQTASPQPAGTQEDRIVIPDDDMPMAEPAAVRGPVLSDRVLALEAAYFQDLNLPHHLAPQRTSAITASTRPRGIVTRATLHCPNRGAMGICWHLLLVLVHVCV